MTALSGWVNFYVIIGGSAGALIGLQFVAISLIANTPAVQGRADAGAAFATPTIIHFSAALLLAAVMSAPWSVTSGAAAMWGLIAIGGMIYTAIAARRQYRQTAYKPEFEDWLFHALLPFAAYAILGVSGFAVRSHESGALFAVAGASLLLLFIGIHNAWDAVTYHVFVKKP